MLKGMFIVLALLFCVTLTGLPPVLQWLGVQNWPLRFFITRLLFWACLVGAWYYCKKQERQKILLWQDVAYPFWVYIGSLLAIYVTLLVGAGLIARLFVGLRLKISQTREQQMFAMLRGRYWLVLLASFTAGFVEEILFRGYLLPRLAAVFSSKVWAVILSSVLFGLLHFGYNSWYHITGAFFIGLVFAVYYARLGNIKILIICHFLWDFVILLAKTR
jgi:membrane protease YdiL (CAAX protease family)